MSQETGRVSRLEFDLGKEVLKTVIVRPPLLLENPGTGDLTCESNPLVAMIEALHTAILTKADPSVIHEKLDALASFAEQKLFQQRTSSRANGKSLSPAKCSAHEAFLSQLNVFLQTFTRDPSTSDTAYLYDFLSDWLIEALCEG